MLYPVIDPPDEYHWQDLWFYSSPESSFYSTARTTRHSDPHDVEQIDEMLDKAEFKVDIMIKETPIKIME